MQGCCVCIIDSKSVKNSRLLLDINLHSFPQRGGLVLGLTKSKFNEVAPYHNRSPQIVKTHAFGKIIQCVYCSHNPPVICSMLSVLQYREITIDKGPLGSNCGSVLCDVFEVDLASDVCYCLIDVTQRFLAPLMIQLAHGVDVPLH